MPTDLEVQDGVDGYHRRPSSVAADEGKVIIDGPDGVAVTMIPDAAEETARRLVGAVKVARGQSDDCAAGKR